jgi:iron complex transport system substrate-binding protein
VQRSQLWKRRVGGSRIGRAPDWDLHVIRIAMALGALAAAVWGVAVAVDPPPGPDFPEARLEGGSFPLTLRAGGREFEIARPPRRVVSLNLSADEILLTLAPLERVVAVTRHAATPGASNVSDLAARIKGRVINAADVESILAFRPDLVLAGYYNRPEGTLLLVRTGVPVVCLREPESIDDIASNTRLLGRILGENERAEAAASRLEAEAGPRIPGSRRALWWNPAGFALGRRSLAADLIERSGGRNLVNSDFHSTFTFEQVLAADPDVLIVETWGGAELSLPTELKSLRDRARAVDARKVLTSAPDILEGLRQVREALAK